MLASSLPGQVTFEIIGTNTSRFISKCALAGIKLLSVKNGDSTKHHSIIITSAASNAKEICSIARLCHLRIHIKNKKGLPFFLFRNRYRVVLMLGWIVFAAAIVFLSKFIFFIEIDGCYRTEEAEIRELLTKVGIERFSIFDDEKIPQKARRIAAMHDDIAKVTITVEGVKMLVTVQETELTKAPDNDNSFRNLYAKCDGVITKVLTYTGKAQVKEGDHVKKGDILISGDLSVEDNEILVHARGKITAQVAYSFTGSAGPQITDMIRSGNTHEANAVYVFGKEFIDTEYEHYETEYIKSSAMCRSIIPIVYRVVRLHELTEGKRIADYDELYTIAEKAAYDKMTNELNKNAKIISKTTITDVGENGEVRVIISVVTEEDIVFYEDN